MSTEIVSILDGNTFVVSDRRGDIDASPSDAQGLFQDDTRFLSKWVLTVNDQRLSVLSVEDLHYYEVQHFLVPGTGTIYVDSPMSIVRRRNAHQGFDEELHIINHTPEPRDLRVRLAADADFADLFEVKDVLPKKGTRYRKMEGSDLILGYRRDKFVRETRITSSQPPQVDGDSLTWTVSLPPHGEWSTRFTVATSGLFKESGRKDRDTARNERLKEVERWKSSTPQLASSWRTIERTYERSVEDLAALRFYPALTPGGAIPAAGLPWFMSVFGRDSILTSLQSIPFMPDLART